MPGLVLFLLAWQAMIAAMMLPSSLPLIAAVRAGRRPRQPRPRAAMAAFLGGYALVWSAFGALAFGFDVGRARRGRREPVAGAARVAHRRARVLALAGAFQFTLAEGRLPRQVPPSRASS